MNYLIRFTDEATYDIKRLKRSEPKAYKKVVLVLVLSAYGHYEDK